MCLWIHTFLEFFKSLTTQSRLLTTLRKISFENIGEKEKMPVTTIFSFSHHVFHPKTGKFQVFSFGKGLSSSLHKNFSKPQAAFPHNHSWNNGQLSYKNESSCNDYHQSSERILAKPGIEPATSCSQAQYATDIYGAWYKLWIDCIH